MRNGGAGGWERGTLTGAYFAAHEPSQIDVLALHESLERLGACDQRQERIVERRVFGGVTLEEAA